MLLVTVLAVGGRIGYIFYHRHQDNLRQFNKPPAPPLNPDYYVTPRKLYIYDLKSAQQLIKQPVWVKVGYSVTFYPFNAARHRTDYTHEAGLLPPLKRLEIKEVVTDRRSEADERQVMAVFGENGKNFAFPIGAAQADDYRFFVNEMLFNEDPHQLYSHWPKDVWDSIDKHEVKPGMSELQADFAVGLGVMESGGDESQKILDYANGVNPLKITYKNGKATEIQAQTPNPH